MNYLTTYSAPPPRSAFKLASLDRLAEIRAELDACEKSARQTEAASAAWDSDSAACDAAIVAAARKHTVLVAQEDDGYYFAKPDAADDISVRHDADAGTIDWCDYAAKGLDDSDYRAEMVDRAVRQEFAGNHDLIRAWERACEAGHGHGPDGPVGADGWVSVRLPD